jgi:serine/threonine-protein kinase
MGIVYRARDLALDRNVALKLLAPELAEDAQFRERFHRESRLAASLDHPSIVPIYDAGEVAGRLYITMRLVEGTDLKRLLAEEGPLEPQRALAILGQVADALDAAHERGLVHRDVKPSNVLVGARDHVYLADFGLSRLVTDTSRSTGDARTLGTVGYVSPEQIRGEELDGRSDLYSLGCLLYECLAGRPPFTGSDTAVVFAHLQQAPPSLTGPDPVIVKALAKDPDERFQSGRELIDSARRALGTTDRRRRRLFLSIAITGVVLAGASLAVALTHGGRGSSSRSKPGADTLLTIDPARNRVASTVSVGRGASAVAVSGGRVWVTNYDDGTMSRIDPATGATLEIPVQGSPTGVAAAGDNVLVANGPEHSLVSIDGATGTVRFVTPLKGDASGTVHVASGDGSPRFADAANQLIGQVDLDVKGTGVIDPTAARRRARSPRASGSRRPSTAAASGTEASTVSPPPS